MAFPELSSAARGFENLLDNPPSPDAKKKLPLKTRLANFRQEMSTRGGGDVNLGGLGDALKGLKENIMSTDVNKGLMGAGLVKSIIGKAQEKRADAMLPADTDPQIQSKRRYFERRARAAGTGTLGSAKRAQRRAMQTGVTKAGFKFGGGQQALNRAIQATQGVMAAEADTAPQTELAFAKEATGLGLRERDEKLQLSMQKFDYAQARANQKLKEGKSAFNLGLARSADLGEPNADATASGGSLAEILMNRAKQKKKMKVGDGSVSMETTETAE